MPVRSVERRARAERRRAGAAVGEKGSAGARRVDVIRALRRPWCSRTSTGIALSASQTMYVLGIWFHAVLVSSCRIEAA